MKLTYFKRSYAYLDISWLVVSIWIFYQCIELKSMMENYQTMDYQHYEDHVKQVRYLLVMGILIMFYRLTYYLSLFDTIAPLITIIFQIFKDITYFIILILMLTFAIAISFQLLAQNQIDFDELSADEASSIEYDTIPNACLYVWSMILGDPVSNDSFTIGKQT